MKLIRFAVPLAILGAVVFIFGGLIRAADANFPIYFPNSKVVVKAETFNKVTYLPLKEIIEHLRGREEWGVNVYCDRAALMSSITSVSPVLRDLVARAEQASPGQSYLMQKKIEALKGDEARVALNGIVDQIENRLREQSDGAKRLRILKVETTEHGELKAKFACLIKRVEFEKFRDAAEQLAQENQAAGVRIELTGPWPVYNFVQD